MRVNWVFATDYNLDPEHDVDDIKKVGASWGSWKTWRSCGTDNVICHDLGKAKNLVSRAFQAVCNFYVPKNFYQDLGRPLGVKLYDGTFNQETDNVEDIVAMHLASEVSDIVLLTGFKFSLTPESDALTMHKIKNYHGLAHSIINSKKDVQWVAVDHDLAFDVAYSKLENLTCDVMNNVLKLL